MLIRPAVLNDYPNALSVLKATVTQMHQNNLFNWTLKYPSAHQLKNDIIQGTLFIALLQGQCAAIMTLDERQSIEYETVSWLSKATAVGFKCLVLHRLAVNPLFNRQGVGRKMLVFMENYARKNQYTTIRFDVYEKSKGAINLYEQQQYTRVGAVLFLHKGNNDAYYCYEKLL
mgnify:CR=1 FL=1